MEKRIPSVPLITCDPYFSVWSPADHLYDKDTCHWTGRAKPIKGVIKIDGKTYRFMGAGEEEILLQKKFEITSTTSSYIMEGAGIRLHIDFFTPLLLTDKQLVSRPTSYIDWCVESLDKEDHSVILMWEFGEELCHHSKEHEPLVGGNSLENKVRISWMGREQQPLLSHSGDAVSIDWGYFYVASKEASTVKALYEKESSSIKAVAEVTVTQAEPYEEYLVAAYDDVASIVYFGEILKGYWTKFYSSVREAIEASVKEYYLLKEKCALLDERMKKLEEQLLGEEYAFLCAVAYRQSIAAHKLVCDGEGNLLFFSKECDSNGCIGTVDISYPSSPLFFLFDTEYVKAMLRPVFKFSQMPVWGYEFAPHDVGRYPYANGQVYGVKEEFGYSEPHNGKVFPAYYMYPAGSDIYKESMQMPVEECGNMLILCAEITEEDGNTDFVKPYMEILEKWSGYLLIHGENPGEQLCTDDFAGHLAYNTNLSIKAIMGIEAYSRILKVAGKQEESVWYHDKAVMMAKDWQKRASVEDHTKLTFDKKESWSLKYNLIWDRIWNSGLFEKEIYEKEIDYYLGKINQYGIPLDNRATYTKSDWILWVVALSDDREKQEKFLKPLVKYLQETPSRNPFSDWFDTITACEVHFHNRTVQGGLFMPLLLQKRR